MAAGPFVRLLVRDSYIQISKISKLLSDKPLTILNTNFVGHIRNRIYTLKITKTKFIF